jgi:hypothetical protein
MRALFYSLTGTGFLLLIAFSWINADTGASRSPASASMTPAAHEPATSAAASRADIRRLLGCMSGTNCGGTRAAAGEALAIALAEHLTNFGADADLARAAVECDEPLAQAVGLRMLSQLPPSAENLSALGNGVRSSSDPALTGGAVLELERYLGTTYEADAQRIVEALVGYGQRTPARAAAALALPFINEHSYEEFHELLGRLDSGAEAAKFLRSALAEYEKRLRRDQH